MLDNMVLEISIGSQIPVTMGWVDLWTLYMKCSYLTHWAIKLNRLSGFAVPEFTATILRQE